MKKDLKHIEIIFQRVSGKTSSLLFAGLEEIIRLLLVSEK